MTDKDFEDFVINGTKEVEIIALKDEGDFGDGYKLYTVGYIKELSGVITQIDSWNEHELIESIDKIYKDVVEFVNKKQHIKLPKNIEYSIRYVDEKEWYSRTLNN